MMLEDKDNTICTNSTTVPKTKPSTLIAEGGVFVILLYVMAGLAVATCLILHLR